MQNLIHSDRLMLGLVLVILIALAHLCVIAYSGGGAGGY